MKALLYSVSAVSLIVYGTFSNPNIVPVLYVAAVVDVLVVAFIFMRGR